MAESIFARVSRLLSATVEDAVDRMEQAGGDAVMREAIREADRAIDQVKAEREATMTRRLQAARQQKMFTERAEELTTNSFANRQLRFEFQSALKVNRSRRPKADIRRSEQQFIDHHHPRHDMVFHLRLIESQSRQLVDLQ